MNVTNNITNAVGRLGDWEVGCLESSLPHSPAPLLPLPPAPLLSRSPAPTPLCSPAPTLTSSPIKLAIPALVCTMGRTARNRGAKLLRTEVQS
jgi:hypothetical protein